MATLEDKLLGNKRDNYCSSSEDEAEDMQISSNSPPTAQSSMGPRGKGPSKNTGPKGVLQDWQDWQEHEKNARLEKEKQLISLCKRTALSCSTSDDQERRTSNEERDSQELEELFPDEDLAQFVIKRMDSLMKQQSQMSVYGTLVDLCSGDEFLKTIDESTPTVLVVIHIYDRIPECDKMNECLSEVCKDYPYVKFCRILASNVGVTSNFKSQGVPAILAYKGGNLIGNFVGLKEEFGSEFFPGDVENFLIENGILEDRNNIPKLLQQKN